MSAKNETTGKRARAKSGVAAERPVTWPDVLRVIQEEPTRSTALARFRAAEFKADDFATRRNARESILEGLVSAEDALESARGEGATAARRAIRAVRRRLEVELWP
jgi:hypothetical protein